MMFGCEEARRYVDAWVDGELDPGAALHVEAHMARCGGCRDEADMIRSLKRSFASLRESDAAPQALRGKLAAMLDAEDAGVQRAAQSTQRRKHAAGFMLAGAALAGLVLATGKAQTTPSDMEVAGADLFPSVLEDITQRHARELPVEVSGSQPEQVANFFRGRLDIPVRPVSFHGVQAQLVGGRISNVRDRMAAALYYDLNGRRMTVFVFDSALVPRQSAGVVRTTVGNQDVYLGYHHGYTVAFSERGGVGYAVTSDLSPQDTMRILAAAEIR